MRVVLAVSGLAALGLSACGGGSSSMMMPPPDPTSMALMAPGVRTVVVPKQGKNLTVIVPPCSVAEIDQDTTDAPPGSNQVVVPKSALDQTVAVQPCIQGGMTAGRSSSVLLSPGGVQSPQGTGQQTGGQLNQLLLPKGSNITKIIVPPCVVQTGSGGSSGAATGVGTNTALPAERNKSSVVAPPCRVSASSSSSGG